MRRRGISEADVLEVIHNPGQTEEIRQGRIVFQSLMIRREPAKTFLLRVFLDVREAGYEVVTVYRTSKVEKYRR
jgi:hypothetical protein